MAKQMIWAGQGPIMVGDCDPERGTADMGYLVNLRRIGCGNRKLTTKPARESKTLEESCSGSRMPIGTIPGKTTLDVSLEMFMFDRAMLAYAFAGQNVLKAAGTVTGEKFPTVAVDDYVVLRSPKASSIVITDSTPAAPVTLVEGTHFKVESSAHSSIKILALPVGVVQPLQADYEHAAYGNVAAFSALNVKKGLIFSGTNQDGDTARVIIPKIDFAMNGDFPWLGDEEAVLALEGKALYVPELADDSDFGAFMRIDALPE